MKTPLPRAAALCVLGSMLLTACAQPPTTAQNTPEPATPQVVSSNEEAVIAAVAKADPAVVSVIITKDLPKIERVYEEVPFNGGFDDFFGGGFRMRVPSLRQNGTETREVGGGTAFFVTSDGLLMTNKHVVRDEEAQYTVLLNDGRRMPATVVGRDPVTDIALLKIDGSGYSALTVSGSEPRLGQTAIAIGNALGEFRNTVSVGIVSGLQRSITAGGGGVTEHLDEIIQTDAAINEGNSGGPLLDTSGNVIGMNTAVSAVGQNIGFALPSPELRRVLSSYRKLGRIAQTYIGVRYVGVNEEIKKQYDLRHDYGIFVTRGETPEEVAVLPDSPAAKAGIREDDLILEADGVKLDANASFARIVQQKAPGNTLTLKIARGSEELTVKVIVEERR